jgi:uncharacterized membrane protein YuzA (DUF378 family)
MKPFQVLYLLCLVLVLVGAINWGLVAYDPKWNVAEKIVGEKPENTQYIYYTIAASALVVAFFNFKHFKAAMF